MKSPLKNNQKLNLGQEKKSCRGGFDLVIGIDEAGRGPLAGPVCAAAVAIRAPICRRDFLPLLEIVRNSKKMTAAARQIAYRQIINHPKIFWSAAMIGPKTIDKINILQASKQAMEKAARGLIKKTDVKIGANKIICLIDGNFSIKILYSQESIIGGDGKVFLIAAASIIAKVRRDCLMEKMDKLYPAYGFARHKGYGTKQHLAAIKKHGACPIHRRSFYPINARGCAKNQKRCIIKTEKNKVNNNRSVA